MKDYSKEKADVFSTPEEGLAKLTEIIGKSYTEEEIANVKKAYELAAKVHEGQKRLSGEPYIMHPLSVALILARLGMDDASIIAAMLHDTVEDTDLTNAPDQGGAAGGEYPQDAHSHVARYQGHHHQARRQAPQYAYPHV